MSRTVALDARPLSMPNTGIARYLHHLVRALVDRGLNVVLVTDAPLQTDDPVVCGCRLEMLPRSGRMRWEQVTLRRHLAAAQHELYIAAWNTGLPMLYRGPTRLAAVVYDLIPLRFPAIYLRRLRERIPYRVALWATLRRAAAVITISQASERDLREAGYGGEILASRVPVRLERPVAVARGEHPYFLYLGGVDPRKRIDRLVQAFERLGAEDRLEHRLLLVGRGFEALEYVRRSSAAPRIKLTGYVSEADKCALIAGAAAVVFPSVYEGYGIPVAEAIALDVPVVTGTGGSLQEVGGEAALYADPQDVTALAAAMRDALRPEVRERLAAARERQREINANPDFDAQVGGFVASLLER